MAAVVRLTTRPTIASIRSSMRKVLRGYAKDKNGNLALIGTIPVPINKDKCPPIARQEKRRLVRQGATIFKKELVR